MSATTSEDAPHPRLAPWLIAGAVVAAVSALLTIGAWFVLPLWFPVTTFVYSPWVDPVMRAAKAIDAKWHDASVPSLAQWAMRDGQRCVALASYLQSPDQASRRIALGALACLGGMEKPLAVDVAIRPLLQAGDPTVRLRAVLALSDPSSIPSLEAARGHGDAEMDGQIDKALRRLRPKARR